VGFRVDQTLFHQNFDEGNRCITFINLVVLDSGTSILSHMLGFVEDVDRNVSNHPALASRMDCSKFLIKSIPCSPIRRMPSSPERQSVGLFCKQVFQQKIRVSRASSISAKMSSSFISPVGWSIFSDTSRMACRVSATLRLR